MYIDNKMNRPWVKSLNSHLLEEVSIAIRDDDTLKLEEIRHELTFRKRKSAIGLLKIIDSCLDY